MRIYDKWTEMMTCRRKKRKTRGITAVSWEKHYLCHPFKPIKTLS